MAEEGEGGALGVAARGRVERRELRRAGDRERPATAMVLGRDKLGLNDRNECDDVTFFFSKKCNLHLHTMQMESGPIAAQWREAAQRDGIPRRTRVRRPLK